MNDKKDSFFDTSDVDALDRQIAENMARPTLVDQLQAQNDKVIARKMSWKDEIKRYWYIYLMLAVSGLFTTMLGLYMGLAPNLVTKLDGSQAINFNTDFGHVATAIMYVVAFLSVTEGAFVIAKLKFHEREEANIVQAIMMVSAMILAGVSIIGTGIAGGNVVASTLGFLSEFKEVSPVAQKWVVRIIPVLLALYAYAFTAYQLSSRQAKAKRLARENKEKQELDHAMRMDNIMLIGQRQFQAAEIEMYKQMVMQGRLTAAEASAALRAGTTLQQLEKQLGRDLDGNKEVGTVSLRNVPIPPSSISTQNYTLEQFLRTIGMTVGAARARWIGSSYEEFARDARQLFGVMQDENIENLYGALYGEKVHSGNGRDGKPGF